MLEQGHIYVIAFAIADALCVATTWALAAHAETGKELRF